MKPALGIVRGPPHPATTLDTRDMGSLNCARPLLDRDPYGLAQPDRVSMRSGPFGVAVIYANNCTEQPRSAAARRLRFLLEWLWD